MSIVFSDFEDFIEKLWYYRLKRKRRRNTK